MKRYFKKIFPHAKVMDIEMYFALPLNERQKYGVYLKPYALPMDFFNENGKGWESFSKEIRKHYPIQGWIREWFLSFDNPLYKFIRLRIMSLSYLKYNIKRFFNPDGKRWRKSWPRHEYRDICDVIVDSNFALIQDFWHEEILNGWVDWETTPQHKEFHDWLKSAIFWIESARVIADHQREEQLKTINHTDKSLSYDEKYKKVEDIEKYIKETDNKILYDMVKYREYFWS